MLGRLQTHSAGLGGSEETEGGLIWGWARSEERGQPAGQGSEGSGESESEVTDGGIWTMEKLRDRMENSKEENLME